MGESTVRLERVNPSAWTYSDVATWLSSVGMGHLRSKFQRERVTGARLLAVRPPPPHCARPAPPPRSSRAALRARRAQLDEHDLVRNLQVEDDDVTKARRPALPPRRRPQRTRSRSLCAPRGWRVTGCARGAAAGAVSDPGAQARDEQRAPLVGLGGRKRERRGDRAGRGEARQGVSHRRQYVLRQRHRCTRAPGGAVVLRGAAGS